MDQYKAFKKKEHGVFSITSIILPVIFCLVSGLLLVLWPEPATLVATYVIGGMACLCGIVMIIMYFRATVEERISGIQMGTGLILIFIGAVLVLNPAIINSLLPKIWGLAMLCSGFLKIQYAFDERSVNIPKWWIMTIFAGVSLIIGVLSLFILQQETNKQVIGALLLAESVLDIVVFITMNKAMKQYFGRSAVPAAPAAPAAPEAPEAPVPETTGEEAVPGSAVPEVKDGSEDSEII